MPKRRKPPYKNTQARIDHLEKQVRASGLLPDGTEIVRHEDGAAKISATFLRFIEPYQSAATNRKIFETLVGLGVAAWNISLFQGEKRQAMLAEASQAIFSETGQPAHSDWMTLLDELIRRKERFFAHDPRLIMSYQVDITRDQYHLSMISTEGDETPTP